MNNKYYKELIYWKFIGLFFITFNVYGQKRTTVLLPNEKGELSYSFGVNALPKSMLLDKNAVKFKLWLSANGLGLSDKQRLKFFTTENIGEVEIGKSSQLLTVEMNLHESLPKLKDSLFFTGKLSKELSQKTLRFYGSNAVRENVQINKQPRMIIDYEVIKEPFRSDWAQTGFNAQHSNAIDWKIVTNRNSTIAYIEQKINDLGLENVQELSNYVNIFNNNPVVYVKTNNNQYFVVLLEKSKLKKIWAIQVNSLPKYTPVINQNGVLYFFTEKGLIEEIDLKIGEISKQKEQNELPLNQTSNEDYLVDNEVTLGYDGTLIFPVSNKKASNGIVAINSGADHKTRWYYSAGHHKAGPISLSPDEKYALFIQSDSLKGKSKLVVLDNTDGTVLAESEFILGSYTNDGNFYIPPVFIQKETNKSNFVYVLNGYKTSNKLFVFQINKDSLDKKVGAQQLLVPKKIIQVEQSNNEGISRPMIGNDGKIYFIKQQELTTYNPSNNEIYSFTKHAETPKFGHLKNDAELIGNASNYMYILTNSNFEFTSIDDKGQKKSSDVSYMQIPNKRNVSNFVVASDFTSYFIPQGGKSVVKQYITNSVLAPLKQLENKTTYWFNTITVDKTAAVKDEIEANIIGKTIKINKGFSVKKGAKINFQIAPLN